MGCVCSEKQYQDMRQAEIVSTTTCEQTPVLNSQPKQILISYEPDQLCEFKCVAEEIYNGFDLVFNGIKNQLRSHRDVLNMEQLDELDRILNLLMQFEQNIPCNSDLSIEQYKLICQIIFLDYPEIFWTIPQSLVVNENSSVENIICKPFDQQTAIVQNNALNDKLTLFIADLQDDINQLSKIFKQFYFLTPTDIIYQITTSNSKILPSSNTPFYSFFTHKHTTSAALPFIFYYLLIKLNIQATLVPVKHQIPLSFQRQEKVKYFVYKFAVEFEQNGTNYGAFGFEDHHKKIRETITNYHPVLFNCLTIDQMQQMNCTVMRKNENEALQRTQTVLPLGTNIINQIAAYLAAMITKYKSGYLDLLVEGNLKQIVKQARNIKKAVEYQLSYGAKVALKIWLDEKAQYLIFIAFEAEKSSYSTECL
ncbi:Transglutaminase/protease [Hexamita inflata]|uniref:Putative n=1 Tax=Hexamita inflata TaxID=28002 RepID=A0AA86NY16_9EUKA|nr:Transglutaminase/protease [Hexamita inflata]